MYQQPNLMNTQNWMTTPYGEPLSGITRSGANKFPNPFFDIASEYIPRDLNKIFEWAEYLWVTFGTYRSVARRVVRYFLTELVLEGGSDEEQKKYKDFLDNTLHILQSLAEIGDNYMAYGNVFVSIFFPFDRYLICPKCKTNYKSDVINYKLNFESRKFESKCPKCNYEGAFDRRDRRNPDPSKVSVITWNPKEIQLRIHPISGKTEYYWRVTAEFIKKIKDQNQFYINDTPWSMLEAIMKSRDSETYIKFEPDQIYHMKEGTLAGVPIKGWGIPPTLPNFKLAYYIQILRRYDEAIAMDYIVPFRIIHPEKGTPGVDDPMTTMALNLFVTRMQAIVAGHRRDPTEIAIAPFPVGYQTLGGEAKNLAPKDNLLQAMDELLNAIGYPAELYKGSLSIQAFPVALRLFEKTWGSLVIGYNDLISWMLKKVSRHFMWGDIDGRLRSVTLADDIERKAMNIQLAAGQDVSKTTAYMPLGIDWSEEQRRIVEEQRMLQDLQREAMEEQESAQLQGGGAPSQPGQTTPPGGDPGATPGDVYEQAKQTAQQLLFQTPENLRRGELIKIKQSNPTLHALVLQQMDQLRQEMARQGGAQMMQQQRQAGAGQGGQGMISQATLFGKKYDELPSALLVRLEITEQICDYSRNDLKKLAFDAVKNPYAKDAFTFILRAIRGG